jgi:hypothetical protein
MRKFIAALLGVAGLLLIFRAWDKSYFVRLLNHVDTSWPLFIGVVLLLASIYLLWPGSEKWDNSKK